MISKRLFDKLEGSKTVTLRELKDINIESMKSGYNRTIYFKEWFNLLKEAIYKNQSKYGHWKGMNTRIMLRPLMIHEHKMMEKCEPHMRCHLESCQPDFPFVMIDIDMDTFNALQDVQSFINEIAAA